MNGVLYVMITGVHLTAVLYAGNLDTLKIVMIKSFVYFYCTVLIIDSVAFTNNNFGSGVGKIFMDDVQCSGNEARLIDCTYDSITSDCTHSRDAGVRCHCMSPNKGFIIIDILYFEQCCLL